MEVEILEPRISKRNTWQVEAYGYSGDGDGRNSAVIYEGPDEKTAKRHVLEAMALANAFPSGRGGSAEYNYSTILRSACEGRPRSDPFQWAANGWSDDIHSDGMCDATIEGAKLHFFDDSGWKCETSLHLSIEEKSFVSSVSSFWVDPPNKGKTHRLEFQAHGLVAALNRLLMEEDVALPKTKGRTPPAKGL